MSTSSTVSSALDQMFERPEGLYGAFQQLPAISRAGHARRVELLERLAIGDVAKMTVVDFGMGSWGFASVYPKLHGCARAIGMDISNAAIAMSRKLVAETRPPYFERFEALQSDGMDIPLPDGSVDLFFSGESIEHVKFPPRYLNEIHRVLKPDGQLVVTTPNRDAIRWKEAGEEYCTSPEHFWLFNHDELIETVSEFFDVQEAYGFNGSFGSHAEDRESRDEATAVEWSRRFEHEPQLATGVILRLTRKPGITRRYTISDIPPSSIAVAGADTYLPLEFGLKGLLLDQPGHAVTIRRPPSDGVVCRFWCHRWSGIAGIDAGGASDTLDLYAIEPGWRNWVSRQATLGDSEIRVAPTLRRNPKALAPQVIYFEAFTWRVDGEKRASAPAVRPGRGVSLQGYGFERLRPFVGTTVFHWFESTEGNVRGPWPPLGGRRSWDGKAAFWREQIKDMMLANIDAIYLHCIDQYEGPRIEFFKAYGQLRAEGYDVPKLAPFLDPHILFGKAPIDVASRAGKDEFARHYIRFFRQYLAENRDAEAASFLLTIDGKLALHTWWVYWLLQNLEHLTREDVRSRLAAALGERIPQLRSGIHMMSTALIDPDLSFTDERMVMFSGYSYAIHSVHRGVDVWHVQPGYSDQNIRRPGYHLPRDGGKNYRRAWDAVVAAMPQVHRVYVESWNEYDEGSGIYAADPNGLFIDRAMHDNEDSFSDTGSPYEYILTTAEGAARINGRPEYDARILWHDAPEAAAAGAEITFAATVRNEGNRRWVNGEGWALLVLDDEQRVVARSDLDDGAETAPGRPRGITHGAPVGFGVRLRAPGAKGRWRLKLVLTRQGLAVGQPLALDMVLS